MRRGGEGGVLRNGTVARTPICTKALQEQDRCFSYPFMTIFDWWLVDLSGHRAWPKGRAHRFI